MSRSDQLKEKHRKSNRLSVDNYDEGSSARTRPFSLEEIMHRRKNKLSENVKDPAKEARNISPGGSSENISDHFESGRVYGRKKSLASVIEKHIPEEPVKVSSGKKVGNTYIKEDNLIEAKDRGNHYSETKLGGGLNNMGRIAKGSKSDKEARSWRKNDGRLSDSSEYEAENKRSRGSLNKDRYAEINREKYERKRRKKYENGDDENPGEYNNERKHEKDRHDGGKRKKWTGDDSGRGAEKKHQIDPAGKGRQADSRGKYEREIRRKYQIGDDDNTQDRSIARKKDLENHRDPGTYNRRERRETAKSHHDESREERRWSRSREHGSRRRSLSLSPRELKRNYHDEERKELSMHSQKESSQNQHSDVDRRRVSTNGSSSHHHRHGGSTSGLGGYSPRKRKSESAVKTPSPTKYSLEKKRAGWDLPPEGADNSSLTLVSSSFQLSSHTVLSSIHDVAAAKSVDPVIVKPLSVSTLNDSTKKNANFDSVQLTQATRPMRRLYLENLPASASEKALMDCLNSLLLSAGVNHVQGARPCISCILHQERGQALVEFLTSEDASAALSFDGSKLFGSIVKIRRPKEYVEVTTGDFERLVDAAVTTSDVVVDSPDKIFIGGISKDLSSEMLMEIAGAFGSLKAYHFETDDMNGPCAFLEYADRSVTLKACAGLNGLKLAGKVLTVVQAMPCASSLENGGIPASYGIPEHAKPLLRKPTQVLKIKNVFTAEALSSLSDMEIEEVLEDVRLECARFGTIKSINVVKHSSDRNDTTKSEKCEVKDVESKGAPQDSEYDDNNAELSFSEKTTNHESKGTSEKEFHYDREELKEDKADNDSSVDVDKLGGESFASESCQGEEHVSDTTFQDMGNSSIPSSTCQEPDSQNTCKDQSELPDNVVADDIGVHGENKMVAGDNDSKERISEVDAGLGTESVGIKKGIDEEDDISDYEFELGSVLVEYGRTEACRAAAHSLHGRLFDDRMVTVEYVALNPYRARFIK